LGDGRRDGNSWKGGVGGGELGRRQRIKTENGARRPGTRSEVNVDRARKEKWVTRHEKET